MNIFKKIFSLMAAVVLFGKCGIIGYAGAEDAPHDIKLTCETKYIDIDDIPEDRIVDLAVSIDNNPGFQLLSIYFNIDSRLKYKNQMVCDVPSNRQDIGCVNWKLPKIDSSEIQCDIFFGTHVDKSTENGELMYLKINLPDEVSVGDFFNVDILKESENCATYVCLDLKGAEYDYNSFSELNCGGIHITDDKPVQLPEENQQDDESKADQNINNEQNNNENINVKVTDLQKTNEVTTVTSTLITSAVSSIHTNVTTVPKRSEVTSVTRNTTDVVTSFTTEQNDENREKNSEKKKSNKIIWVSIAAVLILITGSGCVILIKRSKKDK